MLKNTKHYIIKISVSRYKVVVTTDSTDRIRYR